MKGTIAQIAEKLNEKGLKVNPVSVNGFVRVMEALGKAKIVGQGEKPKRGRPASIYEVEI